MNLLRSEWIKLVTIRTTWTMLGLGLLGEALFAGLYVALRPLGELTDFGEEVAPGTGLLLVLTLVLGVLAITTEFRHGTASSTFLASPRRHPVLVAKLGSQAETARELCYRLYTLCERKKRATEAMAYNALVQSWPEITRLARETPRAAETGTDDLFDKE